MFLKTIEEYCGGLSKTCSSRVSSIWIACLQLVVLFWRCGLAGGNVWQGLALPPVHNLCFMPVVQDVSVHLHDLAPMPTPCCYLLPCFSAMNYSYPFVSYKFPWPWCVSRQWKSMYKYILNIFTLSMSL